MFNLDSQWVWYCAGVVLLILEIVVPGTFFPGILAIGAFVTGVSSIFTDNILLLGGIFTVTSLLGIIFAKPFLEKHFQVNKDVRSSNIDAIIGKTGLVHVTIQKMEKGRVKIEHEDWAASAVNDEELAVGTEIIVREIKGATVIVEKVVKERE